MPKRPKYIYSWWCSRQLRGKRIHTRMRSTTTDGELPVIVHVLCGEEMVSEGGWARAANEEAA